MATFGARLKRERETRKITLDEVARSTKISKRHLVELEEERFKDLPGGIFNKGFVRAYAKQLELDEEEMVREYVAAEAAVLGEIVPPVAMETTKLMSSMAVAKEQQESVRRGDPVGRLMTAAVVIVVLLGLGGFGYKYFADQKQASIANAAAPEHPRSAIVAVPLAETGEAQATPAHPLTPPNTTNANPAHQPLFVELHAKEQSWLLVTADGKQTELTLAANETRSFTAEKELTMKLGNAEAVEIRRNGNRLPDFPPGTKTHSITFTPDI